MRGLGRKLLLVVVSVAGALVVAELGIRWLLPDIGRRPFADPDLGWSSREYRAFDPDRAPPLRAGLTRMLVLGDSYLAGDALGHLNQRFPEVLAAEQPDRFEVGILATGGWGPDQELLAYRAKGSAWQPDLVVVAFCAINDLANVLSNTQGGESRKPYFVLGDDGGLTLHDAAGQPLVQTGFRSGEVGMSSYLLDFVRARFTKRERDVETTIGVDPRYSLYLGNAERWPGPIYRKLDELDWSPQDSVGTLSAFIHEDFPLNAYAWRLVEALLDELRSRVEADGARLVCLLLPVTHKPHDLEFSIGSGLEQKFRTPTGEFTFRIDEPRDRLAAICARRGIDFFDPTEDFLAVVRERELVEACWPNPRNRHFAAPGHRILAKLLADYLAE